MYIANVSALESGKFIYTFMCKKTLEKGTDIKSAYLHLMF